MRRTKEEIMMDMLKVATQPVGPTKLMYSTNLSWKPLRQYLEKLTTAGLIELISGRREIYETTEKGKRLLRLSESLLREFEELKNTSA